MFPSDISNRPDDDHQPPCDHPHECNEDPPGTPPSSSVPPDPGSTEKKRQSLAAFLGTTLRQHTSELKTTIDEIVGRLQDNESYLRIVAACQKEAAEFANHVLERHALHPAVETVDFLATLIGQLYEQATSLADGQMHCPVFQDLLDAIAEAARMAQIKREYLDLESVYPEPLAEFDSESCEVRQAVPTHDPDKHKRVERTLVPGLRYRGAVLRRAQVSVYRHVQDQQ
jgi:hypothetical protein